MTVPFFYIIGLLIGFIAAIISKQSFSTQSYAHTVMQYFLLIGVGVPLVIGFIGHVFQSDLAARRLGWPTGNPFQKELGFWDGASGVTAIVGFWIHGKFWLAAILFNGIFWIFAGILHIWEMIHKKNYHADNVATAVMDFIVPITLIILYVLAK